MVRNCPECRSEMEMNCIVETGYGLIIKKKQKGLFNNISSEPKAAVCTICGHVTLYIDNPSQYRD